MGGTMKVHLKRANAGIARDLAEDVYNARVDGQSWGDIAADQVMDVVLAKYGKHISAALRANGINLADGEALDSEVMLRVINERLGTEIEGWSPDSIVAGLDKHLSSRLSAALGVEVQSVQDVEAIKQALIDSARESVKSGRAGAFMSARMAKAYAKAKAWASAGVGAEDRKKMLNAYYQKKYRRTHKLVWK